MASQKVLKPVKYYKPYASGKFKWKDRLTTDFSICKARISLQKNGEPPILIDLTVDYKTASLNSSVPKVMVLMRYLSGPLKKIHLTFGLSLTKSWAKPSIVDRIVHYGGSFSHYPNDPIGLNEAEPSIWTFDSAVPPFEMTDFESEKEIDIDLTLYIEDLTRAPTNEERPTLAESLQKLCLNSEMSDLKIICDEKEFPCH